ncbi:MAG: alpha/beta hydrolase [Clostridiales Family XIII bacterium]|jgi:pimeloyl-ACP methyl ester carboxylesterase|nr:alpha/beta hydrolase [Clostridiales Family XIII bacterium]
MEQMDIIEAKRRPLWRRILRRVGIIALILVIACAAVFFVGRTYNTATTRIDTPNGIDTSEYVEIGGIEQYIQIRGEDRGNPVILILHGGPLGTTAAMFHAWQPLLESEYTFVDWDQRGAGNTFYRNGGACGEVTYERLVSDIDEIVDYLREALGQEQVIIMGHSFGTEIGIRYIAAHPEKVSHYIGVGQVVDGYAGLETQLGKAAEIARAGGDETAAVEMEQQVQALLDAFDTLPEDALAEESGAVMLDMIDIQNRMYEFLPSYEGGQSTAAVLLFSPRLTWSEARWYLFGGIYSMDARIPYMPLYREERFAERAAHPIPLSVEVPTTFITGEYDWVTPYSLVEAYLQQLEAPSKELLYVEDAGHGTMFDNPEGFADAIREALAAD